MRVGIADAVQIRWGALMLMASTSRGMQISNSNLKIWVTTPRWAMMIPVEAVIGRWPEAVRC